MHSLRFTHFPEATSNRLIILPLFSACWVFSCFRNPQNSDMTTESSSLTCVRYHSYACVYIHTGVGQQIASQHTCTCTNRTESEIENKTNGQCWWYRPFPFQSFYTSSPPFLYSYAWGVQPAKHEEDFLFVSLLNV